MLVKEINQVQEQRAPALTTDIQELVQPQDQAPLQEHRIEPVADLLILELIEAALLNGILLEVVELTTLVVPDRPLNLQEVLQDLQGLQQIEETINLDQPSRGQPPIEVLTNHLELQRVAEIISQDQPNLDLAIPEVLQVLTNQVEALKRIHNLHDLPQDQAVLLEQEVLHLQGLILQDRQAARIEVHPDQVVPEVLQEATAVLLDRELALGLHEVQDHPEVRGLADHLAADRLHVDSINPKKQKK